MRGTDFKTHKMFQQMDKALLTFLQNDEELQKQLIRISIDASVPVSFVARNFLLFIMAKVKKLRISEYEAACTKMRTNFVNYFMVCTELKSDNK